MAKKIIGKLVRDKIPELIKNSGKECEVKSIADCPEILGDAIKKKLIEEATEFAESDWDISELADVFEVVGTILDFKGWTYDQVYQVAMEKEKEVGAFWDKMFLVSVGKDDEN